MSGSRALPVNDTTCVSWITSRYAGRVLRFLVDLVELPRDVSSLCPVLDARSVSDVFAVVVDLSLSAWDRRFYRRERRYRVPYRRRGR